MNTYKVTSKKVKGASVLIQGYTEPDYYKCKEAFEKQGIKNSGNSAGDYIREKL